ncbi:DUF222 domain-containing protein [Rhodococcus sp. NPDC003348]
MFESGVELRGGGQMSTDAVLLATVTDSSRVENQAAARKVLAAGALWDAWIERDVELGSGKITDCGNAAIAELAVRLGCSKTVAESFAALGIDLRLRLPRTRAAFEAGDLDLARARAISRETAGLSAATVTALEPQILAAARHLSPGPLAGEIERLVAAHSPDEAAEQREDVQRFSRRVVKRSGRGGSTVEVTVTPQEGEAFMQLVAEFAGTVCRHDRRGAQEKLVDSVMALAHREPYLECTCGRDDCDAAKTKALPGRRAPLTQITVDLPTLLGLLSEPAHLHGHGLIDPVLARQLAANGTWQAMLTEILELAEELGLVEHRDDDRTKHRDEDGHPHRVQDEAAGADNERRTTNGATETHTDKGSTGMEDSATGSVHETSDGDGATAHGSSTKDAVDETASDSPTPNPQHAPPHTAASPPPRFCVRSFLTRGSRRTAGPVPDRGGTSVEPPPPPMVPTSVGTMAEAILAAVRANPSLAWGTLRDGHGGLIAPPAGALTYRPDAATAAPATATAGSPAAPVPRPSANSTTSSNTSPGTRSREAGPSCRTCSACAHSTIS